MPSLLPQLLAKKLGREFIDTDSMIEEKYGNIPDIFAHHGEEYFRCLESDAVFEASIKQGKIIATGGGAILRDDNLRALRRTGRLYFLDRPLKDLLPTPDRPLASRAEDIERRYRERYRRYCEAADVRISDPASPNDAMLAIRKDFFR